MLEEIGTNLNLGRDSYYFDSYLVSVDIFCYNF